MTLDSHAAKLKEMAEKIIDFTPQEISSITPEEIQRLFYDLQVYQIELQMQNEELQKAQFELSRLNNKLNFTYHCVPVGIITLDYQGFIEQANHTFADMLGYKASKLQKTHFSKLIFEEDKNIFIHRFDAFFKAPTNKSLQLRLQGDKNLPFPALIKGNADDGSDTASESFDLKSRKLIVTITNISDVIIDTNKT